MSSSDVAKAEMIPYSRDLFYEGDEWADLYFKAPDPLFRPEAVFTGERMTHVFHGRVPLSSWLNAPIPFSISITFWGNPVTDLFPPLKADMDSAGLIKAVIDSAKGHGARALIVKDLPDGDPLERVLAGHGFTSVENDPVWHIDVPEDLGSYLKRLSKGRRRGLEGSWKKFSQSVAVRPGTEMDTPFMKKGYDNVRRRSGMRLEELGEEFFSAAIKHPSTDIFIFEKDNSPLGFTMLWRKSDVWFDKYIGTDESVYREVSFYSMSFLFLLDLASKRGIRKYVAGQGCGKEKDGLGFERIGVRLWIKPLVLGFLLSPFMSRFTSAHGKRVYGEPGGGRK
jgi:hypothetical protein